MNYDQRVNLIRRTIIVKMQKLYSAPRNMANDEEAKSLMVDEIIKAINSQLPSQIEKQDDFIHQLSKVWDILQSKQDFRVWFMASDCRKAANKVGGDWIRRNPDKVERPASPVEQETSNVSAKENPAAAGWTIEGIAARREQITRDMNNPDHPLTIDSAASFMGILKAVEDRLKETENPVKADIAEFSEL